YRENIQTVNEFVENDLNKRDKLSNKQKEVVANLDAMKAKQITLLESENIPESVKKSAQAKVDDINGQIEKVIKESGTTPESETIITDEKFELSRLPEAQGTPDSEAQIT